ncbi:hypothetical protein GCM10007880_57590 [Mesorhizobium amorphae]|nr:hypothetical protein GCM10007880_57590 [Mesorhizobium amorphae]
MSHEYPFTTHRTSSANRRLYAFSELTDHTPISTRALPITITFSVEDERLIADAFSGAIGAEGLSGPRHPDHPCQLLVQIAKIRNVGN